MADSVNLDIRTDMVSSPRFRATCGDCTELDTIVMMETEAYKAAHEHIDYWPEHHVVIHPVMLVMKWKEA
jgi:hypothetical protein